MSLTEMLLPEFDHEMSLVRKTLARVPEDKLEWQPHPKSMTLGKLASHLVDVAGWVAPTLEEDRLDLAPADGTKFPYYTLSTTADALKTFDANVAKARAAISKTTDAEFSKQWTLLAGDHEIFTMPRIAVFRSFIMNHAIHHRAQLGVYFRINDIPVPSIYGPSADES